MAHVNGASLMGALSGGINMITGKTEPMDEQPYDDWLMEMLIQHGTDTIPNKEHIPFSKHNAAVSIGHMEVKETMELSGANFVRRLTPKAKRYLDIMNKENE